MKIRLPTLLLALLLLTTPTHAQVTSDKYTHAGGCYAIEYTLKDAKPFCKWKPWQRALFVTGAPKVLDSIAELNGNLYKEMEAISNG